MDARAWRVAAGAGTAALGVVALVAWRGDALSGSWLAALRATALLAVAGLLTATLLAARCATAPPARRQVVVRVPATGSPQTQVRPVAAGARLLHRALLLAVLSAAPVLVVLALASPPPDGTGARTGVAEGAVPAPPAATASQGSTAAPSATAAPSGPATATGPPAAAPDPAGGEPSPPGSGVAGAPAAGTCERTVVAGDSLWGIAAQQLGPGATASQVGDRWRAVYAQNAAAVGPDPDLIRPGLVLRSCG